MKAKQVARNNQEFFCVNVAQYVAEDLFAGAVYRSFDEPALCGVVSSRGFTGYLCVDSRDIKNNCSHGRFTTLVVDTDTGILDEVSLRLFRAVTGEMNTEAEIVIDGIWKFSFKITKYERGSEYGFEQVEDPLSLPDDELLAPFVELKITLVQ